MKIFLLLLLNLFFISSLWAQTSLPDSAIFGSVAKNNQIGIVVGYHIAHPETIHKNGWIGYNVYRKNDGADKFKKINNRPIAAPKSLADFIKIVGTANFSQLLQDKKFKKTDSLLWLIKTGDRELGTAMAIFNHTVAEGLGLIFYDEDVKNNKKYTYYTTKINNSGEEFAPSASITIACCQPSKPLQRVVGAKATANLKTKKDKKTKPDSVLRYQVNFDFKGDKTGMMHHIYRSNVRNALYLRVNELPILSQKEQTKNLRFADTLVQEGYTYYYTVATSDLWDNEVYSDTMEVMIYPPAPPIPMKLQAKTEKEGIKLTWQGVKTPYLKGYNVYVRDDSMPEEETKLLNDYLIPDQDTSYLDTKALPKKKYYYRIVSIDKFDKESDKSAAAIRMYENSTPPLPPQKVKTISLTDTIRVLWQANPEKDLAGYRVLRANSPEEEATAFPQIVPANATFYNDTSKMFAKTTYVYYVQAINSSGYESILSNPAFGQLTNAIKPQKIQSLRGKKDEFLGNKLSWLPPKDKYTAKTRLYRRQYSFMWQNLDIEALKKAIDTLQWQLIYEEFNSLGKFEYNDSLAKNVDGQVFRYVLRPISIDGIEGENSNEVELKNDTPPLLQAPTDLVASQNEAGNEIESKWSPIFENDLAGYHIYRSNHSTPEKRLNDQIIPRNMPFWKDKNIKKGELYTYRVVSVDKLGREGKSSETINYQLF